MQKCGAVVVVLAELLAVGWAAQLKSNEQFFAYDYSKHGADWMAGSCSSRARQSPIDLPAMAPVAGMFEYKYNPIMESFEIVNNGHAFSADVAGMGYGGITYDGAYYNLLNINVHSLSEHAWAGVQMPLELHLVHKRYDNEQLLVLNVAVESPLLTGAALAARTKSPLGALLQSNMSQNSNLRKQMPQLQESWSASTYTEPPATDPGFNAQLQAFLKLPPPPINMKVRVDASPYAPLDLNMMLQGGLYYEYAGSTTAPPCAEIATWLVRKDTLKASDKQVMYLHDAVYKTTADFGNYRELMPLNGRKVLMRQGMLENMPKSAVQPAPMPGNPQQSDREFRAMKWSMDAMNIAKSSVDYIKDLDERLRHAASAHAEALAPDAVPVVQGQAAVGPEHVGVGNLQSPQQMEQTAKDMAQALAKAAHEEIDAANDEISKRAKTIAIEAAREAAGIVGSGVGDSMRMAYAVPTGMPPAMNPNLPPPMNAPPPGVPPMPAAVNMPPQMAR